MILEESLKLNPQADKGILIYNNKKETPPHAFLEEVDQAPPGYKNYLNIEDTKIQEESFHPSNVVSHRKSQEDQTNPSIGAARKSQEPSRRSLLTFEDKKNVLSFESNNLVPKILNRSSSMLSHQSSSIVNSLHVSRN